MIQFNYVVAKARTLCKLQLLSLYVSIILFTFADAEIGFLFFPFRIQNLFSTYVVLGGNLN
jgi:hypothetical protein